MLGDLLLKAECNMKTPVLTQAIQGVDVVASPQIF